MERPWRSTSLPNCLQLVLFLKNKHASGTPGIFLPSFFSEFFGKKQYQDAGTTPSTGGRGSRFFVVLKMWMHMQVTPCTCGSRPWKNRAPAWPCAVDFSPRYFSPFFLPFICFFFWNPDFVFFWKLAAGLILCFQHFCPGTKIFFCYSPIFLSAYCCRACAHPAKTASRCFFLLLVSILFSPCILFSFCPSSLRWAPARIVVRSVFFIWLPNLCILVCLELMHLEQGPKP